MSIAEVVSQVVKARLDLEDCEARYFSGSAHLDELRAAYEQWLTAERRAIRPGGQQLVSNWTEAVTVEASMILHGQRTRRDG